MAVEEVVVEAVVEVYAVVSLGCKVVHAGVTDCGYRTSASEFANVHDLDLSPPPMLMDLLFLDLGHLGLRLVLPSSCLVDP